jgi:O-antigen/teichoic acid export membrane protein
MLASAVRDGDRDAIARYVAMGVRIALVIAGIMVSVTAGISEALLRLVFGEQAAELGGRSLELLSLGFGVFAIFGVLTTVLNSLQRERASAIVTAVAAAAVVALCFIRVRGSEFGETLLFRTASATSVGLAIATVGAAVLVYRVAGAVVAPICAIRVVLAVAVTVSIGRFLPERGTLFTLLSAALLGLIYLAMLLVTRELKGADFRLIRSVIARRAS